MKDIWSEVNGCIIYETHSNGTPTYKLSLIGILLTQNGTKYEQLLLNYITYNREIFYKKPTQRTVSSNEIATSLRLNTEEISLLYELIQIGSFFSHSGGGCKNSWEFGAWDEAENFPTEGTLLTELQKILFKFYDPNEPINQSDRVKKNQIALHPSPAQAPSIASAPPHNINPLKRKYQVFVSSTYEDLKDERQYAIQALLESKCIPSGMELFPAASISQWDLIQQIIDDCDYYILILAGRYGSLIPGTDISYTEREFDYAITTGEPIISFCHKNIDDLKGAKLEKNDLGRSRLSQFREKATAKMCRFWDSPESLSSGIKSAAYHAMENQPQPGWVRATSILAEQDTLAKLQQRILELERELSAAKSKSKEASNKKPDTAAKHSSVATSPSTEDLWTEITREIKIELVGAQGGLESLYKLCRRKKLNPYQESIQGANWRGITASGMTMTEYREWIDENSRDYMTPENERKYDITLSPRLLHVTAPVMDSWIKKIGKNIDREITVYFIYEVTAKTQEHELTTKIFDSEIEIIQKNLFKFRDTRFSLFKPNSYHNNDRQPQIRIYSNDMLTSNSIPELIKLLLKLDVILLDSKLIKKVKSNFRPNINDIRTTQKINKSESLSGTLQQ